MIDLANGNSLEPELAAGMDAFKEQLIIVLIKRLLRGNKELRIPVQEVDSTGQDMLGMEVEGNDFLFTLFKKS